MRAIKHIVIHCTATPQDTTIESMKSYWKDVMKWRNPGYHYIIEKGGKVVQIHDESKVANGVANHNANSIHIAYVGGIDHNGKAVDNRTDEQKRVLISMVMAMRIKYPNANVLGHRDFSPDTNKNGKIDTWEYIKMCPCFNAIPEYKDL